MTPRLAASVLVSVGLLLWFGTVTQATVVDISPSSDGTVRNGLTLNPYGYTDELWANLNTQNDDRAILEFGLSSIPPGSTIHTATLVLYCMAGGGTTGSNGNFRLFGYKGDGLVTVSDFNNVFTILSSFDESVPPTYGWTSFGVTSFLQNGVNHGDTYDGFLIQAMTQDVLVGFGSEEQSSWPKPYMEVMFDSIPEPGTRILVLISGAAMLLFRRRKRI
jgi:hypothetical protein